MRYTILALIGALLVAGCVGQGGATGTTGTQQVSTAADTSAVDDALSGIDSDTTELAEPDVDLDATFG